MTKGCSDSSDRAGASGSHHCEARLLAQRAGSLVTPSGRSSLAFRSQCEWKRPEAVILISLVARLCVMLEEQSDRSAQSEESGTPRRLSGLPGIASTRDDTGVLQPETQGVAGVDPR